MVRSLLKSSGNPDRQAFNQFTQKNPSSSTVKVAGNGRFFPLLRRTSLVALAGSIIYDGFNDFEMLGGFSRFMRSMKIAVVVSADYMYSLYGTTEGTKEYEEVKINKIRHPKQHYHIRYSTLDLAQRK